MKPHLKYFELALKIIKSCMNEYKTEDIWDEKHGGAILD
jgi:hypothetical protein